MTEQQRVRLLLGVLGTAVAIWLFVPIFNRTFVEPIDEQKSRLENAEADLEKAEFAEMELMSAQTKMGGWKDASLPPDPLRAQDVYKDWIRKLAIQSGFTDLIVAPGRRSSKQGVYESVQVTAEGTANLKELRTFLYRFYKTDLTHRLVRLAIENDDNESQLAPMTIKLTAEGLCMVDAESRDELFPNSLLAKDVDADADIIALTSIEGFPTETGFVCSLDNEFIKVTEIKGNEFKVERGIDGSKVSDHSADSVIELFPVNPERADIEIGEDGKFKATGDSKDAAKRAIQYNELVDNSMFTKPRPPIEYKPRLAGIGDRTVTRGSEFKTSARLTGSDPSQGKPVFELAEGAPEGMTVDAETGAIVWQTDDKTKEGEFKVTVTAFQKQNPDKKHEEPFVVTVTVPNIDPVLSVAEKMESYIGSEMVLQATATDDGDPKELTFTMTDAPPGATLNPTTGEFEWNIPADLEPGDYSVTMTVTDGGGKKSSKTIVLTALDDVAKYTSMTGFIDNGRPEMWLRNKLTGKQHTVFKGDSFEIANIKAEVMDIQSNAAILKTSKGLWSLAVGQNLRAMTLLEPAKQPEPSPSESPTDKNTASKKYEDDKEPKDVPPAVKPAAPTTEPTVKEPVTPAPKVEEAGDAA